MPDDDMLRETPQERQKDRSAVRAASKKKPTDFRGRTMVQPDGSHKNTPIPKAKRHWSQKTAKKRGKTRSGKGR